MLYNFIKELHHSHFISKWVSTGKFNIYAKNPIPDRNRVSVLKDNLQIRKAVFYKKGTKISNKKWVV